MTPNAAQLIRFFKISGSGNDFVLIDNREGLIDADRYRDLARQVCRRKISVGADGLILIERDPEVDFKWSFFNADGSDAEMCGNGSRCAARFAYLTGIVGKSQMAFRTLAGIIEAELKGRSVKVQMTSPHSLKLNLSVEADGQSFVLHFVNTGVPHAVILLKDESALDGYDVLRYGRAIRFHPNFQPAGTNANFAFVRDTHTLIVRTYERGVEGETLACGTGCIASVLIAAALDSVASPVEVHTRGGELLTIHFTSSPGKKMQKDMHFSKVYLEGDTRVVYAAELWDEALEG